MPEQNSSISNFKKFLFGILLPAIFTLVIAGAAFNYFFEQQVILKSQICGAYKVNRIITETHENEIPILGSSRAEGGFIPDSLGPDYFNYGLSGSKYDVTLFFLEEECKKKKNTPWIILNLDLDGLSYGLGDVSNYIPNSGYKPVKQLLGASYEPFFSIPLIRYYGRFESYFGDYLNNKIQLTKFTNKGASIEKNVLTKEQFQELVEQRKNAPTAFANDSALLHKLLHLIASHPDRKFVFVVSPYHSSFFVKYMPEGAAYFFSHVQQFPNVHVYDFSHLPLSDDEFMNTSHLNLAGAKIFNRILRDSLYALGVH